jgi:hypothetical protein
MMETLPLMNRKKNTERKKKACVAHLVVHNNTNDGYMVMLVRNYIRVSIFTFE